MPGSTVVAGPYFQRLRAPLLAPTMSPTVPAVGRERGHDEPGLRVLAMLPSFDTAPHRGEPGTGTKNRGGLTLPDSPRMAFCPA